MDTEIEFKTPIQYLEKYGNAEIYIKRDDLIPFSFGGNKVRIAGELTAAAVKRGCDSIISYGSSGSNMNRAAAHMAAAAGLKCHVIIKTDADGACETDGEPLNDLLAGESGADIIRCSRANVRKIVESVMEKAVTLGEKPYYIYGNSSGTGNRTALMMAYFKEYGEILKWERDNKVNFDHIFLAAGTGCTLSGLAAGIMTAEYLEGGDAAVPFVHGISVAREKDRLMEDIYSNLEAFNPYIIREGVFDVTDEYLSGGYRLALGEIYGVIKQMLKNHGIAMDPTYSGKAFYGMRSEISKKRLEGNCLFIHTGGIPGFLDRAGDIFA